MAGLHKQDMPLQYHDLDPYWDMDLMGHPAAGKDWDVLLFCRFDVSLF
jgi:hypothetical protein